MSPAALWMPIAVVVAIVAAPPGLNLVSGYTARWSIVGLAIVAVLARRSRVAAAAAATIAGVGALVYLFVGAAHLVSTWTQLEPYALSAAVVFGLSGWQIVALVTKRYVVDPVVLLAVQLAVTLAGRWLFYLLSGLGLDPAAYGPQTITAALATEVPILALALGGVGLGVTRSWKPTVKRLGFVRLRWWNVCVGILVAQIFLLSAVPADYLTYRLTPHQWIDIRLIGYVAFAHQPLWVLTAIAVLAGVCEETLFRGALQPRFGIILTAMLFAMIHVQYGLTPILGMVFVHGIVYGLLRRHLNTTTAIVTHFAYDDGALFGHTVTATLVWAALMAVILLIPAWQKRDAIAAAWAQRRSPAGAKC